MTAFPALDVDQVELNADYHDHHGSIVEVKVTETATGDYRLADIGVDGALGMARWLIDWLLGMGVPASEITSRSGVVPSPGPGCGAVGGHGVVPSAASSV